MKTEVCNGIAGGLETPLREEMAAFDRLDPSVRELLANASVPWSALQLFQSSPGGVVNHSGFTVETADQRGRLLAAIRAEEDKLRLLNRALR